MGAFFVSADSKEVTWFSMEILRLRADEAGIPLRTRILVGCSVTDAFYGSVHCKGLSGRQESSAGVAEESSAGAGAEGGSESGVASASFWFQESKS